MDEWDRWAEKHGIPTPMGAGARLCVALAMIAPGFGIVVLVAAWSARPWFAGGMVLLGLVVAGGVAGWALAWLVVRVCFGVR